MKKSTDEVVKRLYNELRSLTPDQQDTLTDLLMDDEKGWGNDPRPDPDEEARSFKGGVRGCIINASASAALSLRESTGTTVEEFAACTGMAAWWIKECEKRSDELLLHTFLEYAHHAGFVIRGSMGESDMPLPTPKMVAKEGRDEATT